MSTYPKYTGYRPCTPVYMACISFRGISILRTESLSEISVLKGIDFFLSPTGMHVSSKWMPVGWHAAGVSPYLYNS